MEIKVPDYYNIMNQAKDKINITENAAALICFINEFIYEAYKDGYKAGYTDGVAFVKGGVANA